MKNNLKENVNLSFGYIYWTQRQLFFSYLRSYSTPRFSQEPQTFSGAIWFVTGSCIALPNLPCIHSMTRVTDFCNSLYWVGYNKKTENNKYCQRHEETETLVYCWWKFKTVQLLWKTVWHFLLQLQVTIFSTAFSSLYMIIFKSQFSLKKSTSKQIMFVLDLNIAVQNNYHTTNLNCLKKIGEKMFYSIPSLK